MEFTILRVNMTTGECRFEPLPEVYAGLGGRGLTSSIVAAEVEASCSPLGPRNKLVFAPGLLGGTNCANVNRVSVGCKSPLTGGIKESNAGGVPGGQLAALGISAVVIEGLAREGCWRVLEIGRTRARLVPSTVHGLNNYSVVSRLAGEYGKSCGYISIGRAGEYRLAASSIAFTDQDTHPTRHAGRGGAGAVMGAKGLKAIIVNPEGSLPLPVKDAEAFGKAARRFAAALKGNPVSGGSLTNYGTAVLVNVVNEAGGLPTRNFRHGRFNGHESLSGETLHRLTKKRGGKVARGCMPGCVVQCSGTFLDKGGGYVTKWPELETIWAFGPNAGIDDLDMVARYDRFCDDVGVDTIDVGSALSLLMEAGVLPFGDAGAALKLVEEISAGTAMGRVLGSGAAITGKVFGLRRIPAVKGQSLSAFDPRAIKGQGVTYATTPMGADHTAGFAVAANLLNVGGQVDPLGKEGQIALSRRMQIAAAAMDSIGICLFAGLAALDAPETQSCLVDMLNAKFGLTLGVEDIADLGKKVLRLEVDFNRRAGFTEAADRLPDFFSDEEIAPHAAKFDISARDLESVLDL
ncbi:MAG: aldehyde ferredoxin oxidoreductase [Desulfovibrio sp.]|jgi:aldehyde:ferredoxin oxidoreductase|nr:aldehyde ferredoxin oxidoreductase [Desulfovibrio sp.]